MSTKIILTIEEGLSRQEMDDLRYLLSDAVSEFAVARAIPSDYVEKRYPGDDVYAGQARKDKIAQVARRIRLAEKLHSAALQPMCEHMLPHEPTPVMDYYKICEEDDLAAMSAALDFLPASQFGERKGWRVSRDQDILVIEGPDEQRAFWNAVAERWMWLEEGVTPEAVQ